MSDTAILLVRQPQRTFTDEERRTAWRVLTGIIDGHNDIDKRAWRGLIGSWFKLEEGEMSEVRVHVPRLPGTHRRHMLIEQKFFDSQETFTNFETGFRDWLKLGAGFITWAGEEGKLVPVPRSVNWNDLDELAMREVHLNCIAYLRTPQAGATLWPHLSERARHEMVNGILKGFSE